MRTDVMAITSLPVAFAGSSSNGLIPLFSLGLSRLYL